MGCDTSIPISSVYWGDLRAVYWYKEPNHDQVVVFWVVDKCEINLLIRMPATKRGILSYPESHKGCVGFTSLDG